VKRWNGVRMEFSAPEERLVAGNHRRRTEKVHQTVRVILIN
jgi:hypothetical protein